MTFDPEAIDRFWLAEYAPQLIEVERRRYPAIASIAQQLGGAVEVETVAIPIDCCDGFTEAFYARPEALLDPAVRRSQSAWSFVSQADQSSFVDKLADDLRSGKWDTVNGFLREAPQFEGSLRLVISSHR
jgi:hypothetical protein